MVKKKRTASKGPDERLEEGVTTPRGGTGTPRGGAGTPRGGGSTPRGQAAKVRDPAARSKAHEEAANDPATQLEASFEDRFEDEFEEEEVVEDDDEEEESEDDEEDEEMGNQRKQIWRPGVDDIEEGEQLDVEMSCYDMLHRAQVDWPCLSFDIMPDSLGMQRSTYPMTCYVIAGTQADESANNRLYVMK